MMLATTDHPAARACAQRVSSIGAAKRARLLSRARLSRAKPRCGDLRLLDLHGHGGACAADNPDALPAGPEFIPVPALLIRASPACGARDGPSAHSSVVPLRRGGDQ